jgi:transcription initiation factor TFIID subunit TAF12
VNHIERERYIHHMKTLSDFSNGNYHYPSSYQQQIQTQNQQLQYQLQHQQQLQQLQQQRLMQQQQQYYASSAAEEQDVALLMAVRIMDGLFVGNAMAAQDDDFLFSNKVTHIVNCAGLEAANIFIDNGVEYLTFPWRDVATTQILDSQV